MKKILITFVILTLTLTIRAQEKYSYSAKFGTGISMNSPGITPLTLDLMAHYNLNSHWIFGAGSGIGKYDNIPVIPLQVSAKYLINPRAKFNLFIDGAIGYGFAVGKEKNGGFLLSPEFGVQHTIRKHTFLIAAGYAYQKLERLKSHTNEYISSQFVEKLNLQSISLKLGVVF